MGQNQSYNANQEMGRSQRTPGKPHSSLYWEKNKYINKLNKKAGDFKNVNRQIGKSEKSSKASDINGALHKYRLQQQLISQLSIHIKEHVHHLSNRVQTENSVPPKNRTIDWKPMNPTFDGKPVERNTFPDRVQMERHRTLKQICDKHPELSNDSRYIRMDYVLSDRDNRLLYAMVPKVIISRRSTNLP